MPSIRLVDVTKRFGDITALDRVNLEIEDGEYVCILGPTGSGKTTLLRLIAGVIKPTEGEIYIDGEPASRIPPQERNAAYLPQQYALFPHMRVIDNVAFGPMAKGLSREEAYEISKRMLEMTRLAWRMNSYPHELSGGMQQRLALARALASGAELLLLDEPLGALDARLRVELRYRLRELVKDEGLTAIHVTHDQEEAMAISDRIVVLRDGRIQQEGRPIEVYREPNSIFVANFVGGANFLEGFVHRRLNGSSIIQLRGGLRVRVLDTRFNLGERVVVAIREEATGIVPSSLKSKGGRGNLLPGRVRDISFLGSVVVYEVELVNGEVLNSKVPIQMDHGRFRVGDEVLLSLNPEHLRVYPYPPLGLYRELEAV